jgi:integrase
VAIIKLTKRAVDACTAQGARYTVWDTEVGGFGLRVTPAGFRSSADSKPALLAKVYVLKYRFAGQQRWITIGRHGSPWTPEMARTKAQRLLGDVAGGIDPAKDKRVDREAITVARLCDLYLAEGVAHKKTLTLQSDRGRIANHIKPLLGKKRVDAITCDDIERLQNEVTRGKTARAKPEGQRHKGRDIQGGAGVAARCVELMSTLMAFAINRRLRTDNPVKGVKKAAGRKMERYLTEAEIAQLSAALEAEGRANNNVFACTAIELLLLTGCRRGEIMGLQWTHVDFERQCLRLPDSKTGAKVVFLNAPALTLLAKLPRMRANPYVIAGALEGAALVGIGKIWERVRKRAGLEGVRLHDLRHNFASIGAGNGLSLPMIGALLGHKNTATTQRYAHLAADPIRAAGEAVGARIVAAMTGENGG